MMGTLDAFFNKVVLEYGLLGIVILVQFVAIYFLWRDNTNTKRMLLDTFTAHTRAMTILIERVSSMERKDEIDKRLARDRPE